MLLRSLVPLLALIVAPGCRARAPCEPGPSPAPPQLRLLASSDANGRGPGDAAPTELRIYQLRARDRLAVADYDAVRRAAKQTLGPDLVGEQTGVLYPGESLDAAFELNAETRFIAAVAFVREPVGGSWRALTPLPVAAPQRCPTTAQPSGYEVRLRGMKVTLVARRGPWVTRGAAGPDVAPASLDVADAWNDEAPPRRRRRPRGGKRAPGLPNGMTPNVSAPNVMGPNVMGPNVMGPNVMGPNVMGPNVMGPNVMAPNVSAPNVSAPNVSAPNVPANPTLSPPAPPALEITATPWRR